MIYIFTALFYEAKPIIEYYDLEKNVTCTQFQVFENDEIRLVITGQGNIAAAVAVSHIFTYFEVKASDYLINIGCCAHVAIDRGDHAKTGQMFLCNKITDQCTGFTYYPDIIENTSITEAAVITGNKIYTGSDTMPDGLMNEIQLYDMESAAIYQAATYYIGPHQMAYLKIISDKGIGQKNADLIEPTFISLLMKQNLNSIHTFLMRIHKVCIERDSDSNYELDLEATEKLSTQLHCSIVMKNQLHQMLTYCRLAGIEYEPVIQDMTINGYLPCKDKKEGKIRLEQLKSRLLS